MHYDLDTHTYICDDRFSPETEAKIRANLGDELGLEFDYFMLRNWGVQDDVEDVEIDLGSTLSELEEQIKVNVEEEQSVMRTLESAEREVEDLIDFSDAVGTLRLTREEIELADEFSIGLFDIEDD